MPPQESYAELPPMPNRHGVIWNGVTIVGLVDSPLSLDMEDLASYGRSTAIMDFKCYDGWVATAQRWEGVPLSAVLGRAGADPDAKYVVFSCGEFVRTLTLDEAKASDTLLATVLNGRPLADENGGPCRLLAGNRMGPFHVKWLQRIEVTNEAPEG